MHMICFAFKIYLLTAEIC